MSDYYRAFMHNVLTLPPNMLFELTPLRGHKIAAILKTRTSRIAISIYEGGAAQQQRVGPQHQCGITLRSLYNGILSMRATSCAGTLYE